MQGYAGRLVGYAPPLAQGFGLLAAVAGGLAGSFVLAGVLILPACFLLATWSVAMLRHPDLRAQESDLRRKERFGRWLLTPAPTRSGAIIAFGASVLGAVIAVFAIGGA